MRLSRHVALTLAFATPAAFAQSSDAPALAPIAVSADPLGLDLNSTALPTTILDGQALVERRQGTLGGTLDGLPGVHADTFGGGASRPVIRGQTAPRVSVLSDGSPLMDASAVSPDHATTIEPLLADRIEILRGPATLRHGGGAIGGVVNVLDKRVPTEKPEGGLAAEAELRGATGTKERAGIFGITGGSDDFVVRVEGLKRRSSDYEVPDWPGGKLAGSYSESTQGSLGMSWIGPRGYVGVAFTHIESKYGLPGHNHEYESCHPHGDHLHCGGHGPGDAHDHDHGAEGGIPYVRLRSDRVDLRAEYLDPLPGFAKLRLRSGYTHYRHDEIEGGQVGTRFKNEASTPAWSWSTSLDGFARRDGPADGSQRFPRRWRGGLPATQQDAGQRHFPARRVPPGRLALRGGRAPGLAARLARGRAGEVQPVGDLAVGGGDLGFRAPLLAGAVGVALAAPAVGAGAVCRWRAPGDQHLRDRQPQAGPRDLAQYRPDAAQA